MSDIDYDSDVPLTSAGAARGDVLTPEEIKRMWTSFKVRDQPGTVEQCIEFAEQNSLLLRRKLCRTYRMLMVLDRTGNLDLGSFRCRKGKCRANSSISRAKGTWFENAKISLPLIFYLMYCYARCCTKFQARLENYFDGPCLSSRTIMDWYIYCREAVVIYQVDKEEHVGKIGGPGKIVQIDESKFAKKI